MRRVATKCPWSWGKFQAWQSICAFACPMSAFIYVEKAYQRQTLRMSRARHLWRIALKRWPEQGMVQALRSRSESEICMLGGSGVSPWLHVTPAVKLELMVALGRLPLLTYSIRAEASGLATVTDASEIVLGVCASTLLSDHGRDTLSLLRGSPFLLGGDSVTLIELFAGACGVGRGCERAALKNICIV